MAVAGITWLCVGCSTTEVEQPPATITPTATLAVAAIPTPGTLPTPNTDPIPTITPTPPRPRTPTPSPTPDLAALIDDEEEPFEYQWPAYQPEGFTLAPNESRVARDEEVPFGGVGFFVVTFNAAAQKLVVGGGSTEALPLQGEQQVVTIGEREAQLITSGDQRQIQFEQANSRLFIYGFGVSEEEIIRVAESLEPISITELRSRVNQAGGAPSTNE